MFELSTEPLHRPRTGVQPAVTADQLTRTLIGTGRLSAISELTPRQLRVFTYLGEGLSNKQIARELGLHESTVKVHVSAVLAKLNCPNRTAAALLALYNRLRPMLTMTPTEVGIPITERSDA